MDPDVLGAWHFHHVISCTNPSLAGLIRLKPSSHTNLDAIWSPAFLRSLKKNFRGVFPLERHMDLSWFNMGGIDFLVQPVDSLEKGWWKDDDEHFDWLFEQVKYLLTESTLWESKVHDAAGVYFQMYDNLKKTTVAAAAMALFVEPGKSAIHEMTYAKGAIEISRTCMETGNFDI